MIIKIKTFSGENLYIPEEDYLNEVMYSKPLLRDEQVKEDAKKAGLSLKDYIARQRGIAGKLRDSSGDANRLLPPEEDETLRRLMGNKYYNVRSNISNHHNARNASKEWIKDSKIKADKINRAAKGTLARIKLRNRAKDLRDSRNLIKLGSS